MNKIAYVILIALLGGCAANNSKENVEGYEEELLRKWILSRCIGHATDDAVTKKDAFNSASAYLEISRSPVERFTSYEAVIKKVLQDTPSGSIDGSFKMKACIDYAQDLKF
jgi:hypothetical protein